MIRKLILAAFALCWVSAAHAGSIIAPVAFPPQFTDLGSSYTGYAQVGTTCPGPTVPWNANLQQSALMFNLHRFVVRQGDTPDADLGRNPTRSRCEYDFSSVKLSYDVTYMWAESQRFTWSSTLTSGQMILSQMHLTSGAGLDPMLSLRLETNGKVRVVYQSNQNSTTPWTSTQTLVSGVTWVDTVWRCKFNAAGAATLEVWANFGNAGWSKVVDLTGISVGHTDDTNPFFKFGIYRYDAPETLTADYANVRTPSKADLTSLTTFNWWHPQ